MIFDLLSYGMTGLAVVLAAAAWLRRAQRTTLLWAAGCAGVAAGAAWDKTFWPVAVFAPMVLWALVASLTTLTASWRTRAGLALYVVVLAGFTVYPTYHDEVVCSERRPPEERPDTCPEKIAALSPEQQDQLLREARAGDLGFKRFLLHNIGARMVRGLDLKGGLRLVYTVEVDEALRDKRDRYYDDLRLALTKAWGLAAGEEPTVAEMQRLGEHLTLVKPRDRADAVVVRFKSPDDARARVNEAFLTPFLREMTVQRAADGAELTLTIHKNVAAYIRERAVNQAKETVHRRIDGLGLKEAQLSVRDEDLIIEVPGKDEKGFQEIRDIVSQTARLEFKMLDDEVSFFEAHANASAETLPKGLRFEVENAPIGPGKSKPSYFARLNKLQTESLEETLKTLRAWVQTLPIDEDHEVGYGKIYEFNDETNTFEVVGWRTYYLRAKAELTGDMVRDALATPDQSDTGIGGWHVNMELTPRGADLFEAITGANVKKRFAIILDGRVESAPEIREKIGGGRARITMGAGSTEQQRQDAQKLELVLRSGALPAPISPSNEQRIGPTLGHDSIDLGVRAALIGSIVVFALMLLWYRQAGIVTTFSTLLNLGLQLTILSTFNASMTLPGIAGLALTVGMAVDANVLVNERIRDELRAGRTARAAVGLGYDRAFSAIVDGNVTTLIAAFIMSQYGTGPIKGFANTLIIGMGTNLFTAIMVTRLVFDFWVRGRRDARLGLS